MTTTNETKATTVRNKLAWQNSSEDCRELLKALTGTDCVPCEGGVGVAGTASLNYYEKYSGKGYSVVYKWDNDFENDTARIEYVITRESTWDSLTPIDRLVEWLDNSTRSYDVWKVVEVAAERASADGGTQNVWGEARALSAMSGIRCEDVMEFLGDFADANYHRGRRIG